MRPINEEWVQSTLEYIREYARENNGEVPVLADIMKETGMVKSAAFRYIMILKDRGYIEYNGKGTLQLTGNSNCYKKYGSVKVPIYGSVICGTPEEEEQENPEYGNTLKRLFIEDGIPRLHPENKKYKDIYPKRLEMQGLALRVIKQIS